MHRIVCEKIELVISSDEGVPNCFADPAQLETVIINLATYARDAMPKGGKLRIKASTAYLENDLKDATSPGAPYVCIAIADDGIGMTSDMTRRAVEPFFTTKPIGEGSGLGLSMAAGFAAQSSGSLRIHSRVNEGNTVTLYLPQCEGSPTKPTTVATRDFSLDGVRVLVLDVEEAIAHTIAKHLTSMGCKVSTASSAQAAQDICDHDNRTDVFLLDMVLPGESSGVEVAKLLAIAQPQASVIFMSGYTHDRTNDAALDSGAERFLQKPITRLALFDAIVDTHNSLPSQTN